MPGKRRYAPETVALKLLAAGLAEDESFRDRFPSV